MKGVWRSGRVVDCNPEGCGIESRWWTFDDSFVGKLTENCRKTPLRENKNRREIPMISKYSVFVVGTRRIYSIFMSKKFPSPLQVSLLHPVRLAEFSVNFFFSEVCVSCWQSSTCKIITWKGLGHEIEFKYFENVDGYWSHEILQIPFFPG